MTAPVFALAVAALAVITGSAIWLRRHPVWQGPGVRHHGSPPRPPRQHPAPRDWGESRLPSAADRTGQLAAIAEERVMPGRRDGIPHADADQYLPPWDDAAEPVTPEPPLPPLPPAEYLTAPAVTHAMPRVTPGRVHQGCDLSDTGQQAALTALSTPAPATVHYAPDTSGLVADIDVACGILRWAIVSDDPGKVTCQECLASHLLESDRAICLCGKVPDIPGEPVTSEADCPAHGSELPPAGAAGLGTRPGEDATLTDMRPVPAPVAARENAAARWHLKAHVGYVMKRKPPLREYVEETIGPGVADLNPAYERDAAAFTVPPAEDFDSLLATARAGAVSE